ncbi:MAG TPA: hypothetical protein P5287_03030 [bacterium]|nr:hypothetical protein [bacterium]
MQKTPEERLRMACSQFGMAKQMIKDALTDQHPGLASAELKERIFLRIYGAEFNSEEIQKITGALKLNV